jgi:hypothetical protein
MGGEPASNSGGASSGFTKRIQITAEQASKDEYNLRQTINTYNAKVEKQAEDKKLRAIEKANTEQLRAEAAVSRKKLRDEATQARKDAKEASDLKRSEREQAQQEARVERDNTRRTARMEQREKRTELEHVRARNRMWRDLSIGGLAVSALGGGGVRGMAGGIGGLAGYGIAKMAGAGAGAAGLIAEIVGEIVKTLVNPMSAAYGAAKPYFDYQTSAYSLGRYSGNSGAGIERKLYPGAYRSQPWMEELGSSAPEAIKSLSSLGVAPQGNPAELNQLAETLRRSSLSPAFTNMAPGTVESLVGKGAGYGLTTPTAGGAESYLKPFMHVVEEANVKGLDSSKVLESMQGSLETIAKSDSLGASPAAIAAMLRQNAMTGTPGGLTGASTLATQQGMTETLSNVTAHPSLLTALLSQIGRFGNLKSAKDVKAFIGEENYNAASPEMRDIVIAQAVKAAQAERYPIAVGILTSAFMQSNKERAFEILDPFVNSITGGNSDMKPGILSGLTGATQDTTRSYSWLPKGIEAAFARYNGGGKGPGREVNVAYGKSVAEIYKKNFGIAPGSGKFDKSIGLDKYKDMLLKAGMAPDLAPEFARAGLFSETDPLSLAAIAAKESEKHGEGLVSKINPNVGFVHNDKYNSDDFGMMQINSANWGRYPGALRSVSGNLATGADIFRQSLGMGTQPLPLNLPVGANRAYAEKATGDLTEANAAIHTLIPAAETAIKGLTSAIDGMTKAAKGFSALWADTSSRRGYSTPGWSPLERPRP